MVIFASEAELIVVLDKADAAVEACVRSAMDVHTFYNELWHLYGYHALDGHESDEEEKAVLARHKERIAWIQRILDELNDLCSDEDATKAAYVKAGRFGSAEALRRLRALADERKHKNA